MSPLRIFAAVLSLTLVFSAERASAKLVHECIYLVPVKGADPKIIEKIKCALPQSVPITIRVGKEAERDMPPGSYDASERQYNAMMVIDDVSEHIRLALTNERALAVTDADLYVPGSDFVSGFADPKKGVAVISTARLRNEFYGLAPDTRSLNERALKEALRQLGKSWGMEDCASPKCAMNPSEKIQDIDRKREKFCYKCRIALENRYEGGTLMGSVRKK